MTPEQEKKAIMAAEIIQDGDLAVLKKILEFADTLDEYKASIPGSFAPRMEALEQDMTSSLEIVGQKVAQVESDAQLNLQELDVKQSRALNEKEKQIIANISAISTRLREEIARVRQSIVKPEPIDLEPIQGELTTLQERVAYIEAFEPDVTDLSPLEKKILEIEARIPSQRYLEEIRNMAAANSMPITTTNIFKNGQLIGRAKNLNFTGTTASVSVSGDQANVAVGGSGHTIEDEGVALPARTFLNFVGAGVVATDDSANDATKVTISTSAGAGFQQPTGGAIDGSNAIFTWATAPNAIIVDGGRVIQKVSSDGTVNWTGTTTTTLAIAPNSDIFGVA